MSLQRRGAGSVTRGAPQPLPGLREPVGFAGRDANEVVVDFGCGGGIDVILAAHKVGPAGCVGGAFSEKHYFETVRQAGVEHLSVVSVYPLSAGELDELASCPGPGAAAGKLRLRRSLRSRPAVGWLAVGSTRCLERRRSPLYS